MDHNDVWDLVELPKGCKRVGCKWVYKTKCDSNGKIELYKAKLVAKSFIKKDGHCESRTPSSCMRWFER